MFAMIDLQCVSQNLLSPAGHGLAAGMFIIAERWREPLIFDKESASGGGSRAEPAGRKSPFIELRCGVPPARPVVAPAALQAMLTGGGGVRTGRRA
ncbi:MAG: hypothetical protein IPO58_20990 [Betaproteobacteria bacterium]|nr:hypothetical protein [Betaproteobacteria bacterium]